MKRIAQICLGAVFCSGVASATRASEISFSFGSTLASTETAGAPGVSAGDYNAFTNSAGAGNSSDATIVSPLDNSGTPLVGTSAKFTSNSYSATSGGGTNDAHLFSGFVDQSDDTSTPSTLTVTNVPYASYDVYIYMRNDRDGTNRTGVFTIGTVSHYVRGPGQADLTFADPAQGGGYVVSNDTTQTTAAGTTAGDYTVFTGLNDNTLTVNFSVGLSGDAPNCCERNKFVGLQIVQTPEPASVSAFAFGGVSLLALRRRARIA